MTELTIEGAEFLVLLRRSPDTFWTLAAASQRLGFGREVLEEQAGILVRAGLVVRGSETGAYRYAPRSDDALKAFADAFKFRRGDNS